MKGVSNGRSSSHPTQFTIGTTTLSSGQALLQDLLGTSLVLTEDWEALPDAVRELLLHRVDRLGVLTLLVEQRLLTDYQAARIEAGKTFGLLLGNYRILERIGAGGMGVVFRAEHLLMRRVVAIKVLAASPDDPTFLVRRFYTEMRAISQLQHPNIVGAVEAGKAVSPGPDGQVLHYFVMEYVPGQDLEDLVNGRGPLEPSFACDLIHQVASALAEAHKHNLVHRDIKPSNVLITPEGQAKLLDFGLARHFRHRQTEAGTMLGTLDYMAPEQAQDAGSVDIRADIYGLGGTLFWCLTGRPPFEWKDNIVQQVSARLTQPPPSARQWRPELPGDLDALLARMMAVRPDDRFPTPQAVMRALLPFFQPELREHLQLSADGTPAGGLPSLEVAESVRKARVLVVDDEPSIRLFCRFALQAEGLACDEAENGRVALETLHRKPYDLVLSDFEMPELKGPDLCRRLREQPPSAHLKIILCSGRVSGDDMAQVLLAGADDYLTKPLSVMQLRARVKAALRLKEAQDRSDLMTRHLLTVNQELEKNLNHRDSDLVHARNALVLALAKLVSYRDSETGSHLHRLQRFSRCLAEEAASNPNFATQITPGFLEMLECCAPLHDIGKVGLPDHILMKPGKLDADERVIMQTHTVIGSDTLRAVAKQHGFALAFLQTAADIARHHHERWDGRGYPDRLTGTDIPLAARLVAIGDVYDALRSRRVYKPALSHAATLQVMAEGCQGQFDPALVQVFLRCAPHFEVIFREVTD